MKSAKKVFASKLMLSLLLGAQILSVGVSHAEGRHEDANRDPNRRLNGTYGFAATGYFGANYDTTTKQTTGAVAERVGVYSFDGKGNCTIHSLANKAGLAAGVLQDTEDCTYQVSADGTGQLDATLGGKTFLTYFVLVNNDKEFMFTRREGTSNPADQGGASLIFAIAKKQ
ncbi:hypothetical protein [Methylomonas albis]|uniref:Lipocalin-like domain-containing protein n=1 Tax=Methylomonas albis TaxID=1854563 RepID=A0ABR9D4F5_9GAMM|nr:hypothetical protein [Methylomonas albis]MBD9356752.1 hypothetical protein [Methylomonas albis]